MDDSQLWQWYGEALGDLDFYELAIKALENVVKISPGNKKAKLSLEHYQKKSERITKK